MHDGKINVIDSDTNTVECSVRVHLRRDYPESVVNLLIQLLKKGIEEWQDRVIIMDKANLKQ